jgi:hypothetical protein
MIRRLGQLRSLVMCSVLACGLSMAAGEASADDAPALPDWSGWWGLDNAYNLEVSRFHPPPLRPADLAALRTAPARDVNADPLRYCRPRQFTGYSGGFAESVEFLFTPGRVTLTNESGLIRRIYVDGRAVPDDAEETYTGTSVGHWEGQTLVVQTVAIHPDARYPESHHPGWMRIGKHVRITERIALKDANTLEFEIVTVAPELFTAPDRRRRTYTRVPKQLAREVNFCVEFDRSFDPQTRTQRFDMTPPADLPKPPGPTN